MTSSLLADIRSRTHYSTSLNCLVAPRVLDRRAHFLFFGTAV
jgi:hypothetical protein